MKKSERLQLIRQTFNEMHAIAEFEDIAPTQDDIQDEEKFLRVEYSEPDFETQTIKELVFG